MKTPWFKKSFGAEYLEIYPHRSASEADDQLPHILSVLELKNGEPVLDLACGAGRHTSRLRKEGFKALGMDLSATLLREAGDRYPEQDLPLVQGDMRSLPFPQDSFSSVINIFTSFGYFDTDEENLSVLEEIHRVLKPGGRLFLDYLNPDLVLKNLVPHSERKHGESLIIEDRKHNRERGRVEKTIQVHKFDSLTGSATETKTFQESVGLYSLPQMRSFFDRASLPLVDVFGNYDLVSFEPLSPRMILLGRKPA